jgi:uncharacterized protein YdeI (YjbR/CyaY-like superfamily)
MSMKAIKTLEIRTRGKWRKWLAAHYDSVSEIWLIFNKRHTGLPSLAYEDAVAEALCFGWIDSLVRRLDDARYARKFTPRTADSKWSTANRQRYDDLKARGLLAEPGLNRAPTSRSGDARDPRNSELCAKIEQIIRADPLASKHFVQLAPSYQRTYIGWIASAKREQTRERRLREALRLLAAGIKLGLK